MKMRITTAALATERLETGARDLDGATRNGACNLDGATLNGARDLDGGTTRL